MTTIIPDIESGKAYDMNVLLSIFKTELEKRGNAADNYTKQKLKARLTANFKEQITFYQPPQRSKPEILYSSSISLIDVINAASNSPPDPNTENSMAITKEELFSTDFLDIYSVACRVREEILKCNGIDINPLNVQDLQFSTAKMLLPETL